jgi:isoamylase
MKDGGGAGPGKMDGAGRTTGEEVRVRIWPGSPYPLGATYDGAGTNFSVFSEVAERVELCLFDEAGREERVDLPESTGFNWHGYLPGIEPGQRYGLRVHGPWNPDAGQRANPAKLLVDPYAKAVAGQVSWHEAVFPYRFGDPEGSFNDLDSAPYVPRSVVTNPFFDWGADRPLRTPLHDTVIYEVHVKGFTRRHPGVPEELRGTYAGLAHPAALEHLKGLGVTAVELLPVHQFVHDSLLAERALSNYWGYNTLAYLAPHGEYASGGDVERQESQGRQGRPGRQVMEFKSMVKALHEAGLEVILDVVYNHTCEGNHLGPMLSWKGLDNAAYYRLVPGSERYYMDFTGTGNSLNMRHPNVLQLIMDSLRYWVLEMHVDGFRFDLAAALARELYEVDRLSAFFDVIQQDPVISQVKLIAEPWDVGEGGYQVGNFPTLWSEWNGRFRDAVRDVWRGAGGVLDDLGYRLTGSSDLYQANGRRPYASINFVTAHDGFTLADLVSYDEKHNQANGEDNRDGESFNRSWNHGVEGPTGDPAIVALRARQRRNLLATLLLSQGVPMLLGGDEIGRTQQGNNNAYCQDNEISWLDWENADGELLEFTRRLVRLRREHANFRRRRWFQGRPIRPAGRDDIAWFQPDGGTMEGDDWNRPEARTLGVFLNGRAIHDPDARGEKVVDDTFFLILHAGAEPVEFRLPDEGWGARWVKVLDTQDPLPEEGGEPFAAGAEVPMVGRSVVLLRRLE